MTANLTANLIWLSLLAPLSASLALAVRPWRSLIVRCAPLTAVPAILLALTGAIGTTVDLPWLVKDASLQFDFVAKVFLLFTSILWLAAGWYGQAYLAQDKTRFRFYLFFLLAMAGNFILIVANDIPSFYIGFALMSLTSAGLVAHRGDQESLRAAKIYLTLVMIGEVLLFTAFAFLFINSGSLIIADVAKAPFSPIVVILVLVAFGIKAGALTLHFWLPLAHPAAPVPASAVLSGAMIKAGLLGWLRFLPLGETSLPEFGYLIITAGLIAAFFGAFVAAIQSNPKAVLAYSSISQMGIISTGVGIGLIQPEQWATTLTAILIYTAHHGLAKGALFLGCGTVTAAASRRQLYLCRAGLIIPALALAGAPLTSGALAKVALKSNLVFLTEAWATWLTILMPVAAIGTTLAMLRFLWLVWPSRQADKEVTSFPGGRAWLLLVVAVIVNSWLLPGADEWIPTKFTLEKLWDATWPLILGGTLAYIGNALQRKLKLHDETIIAPGDMGILIERMAKRIASWVNPSARANLIVRALVPQAQAGGLASFVSRLIRRLIRLEYALRQPTVSGILLLTIIATVVLILAQT